MRKNEAKRAQVAEELLETERSYVAGIKLLVSAYKLPLENTLDAPVQHQGGLVTKADVARLFLNIEDICEESDKVLYALEARVRQWGVASCVGDVFLRLTPALHLYNVYNGGYTDALACFRELSLNKRFEGVFLFIYLHQKTKKKWTFFFFLAFCDAQRMLTSDQSKLDFVSLSIMPIQRVPRYRFDLYMFINVSDSYFLPKK